MLIINSRVRCAVKMNNVVRIERFDTSGGVWID